MKITAKKKPMRETEDLIKIEVKQCWKAKGLDWAVDWGGEKDGFSVCEIWPSTCMQSIEIAKEPPKKPTLHFFPSHDDCSLCL